LKSTKLGYVNSGYLKDISAAQVKADIDTWVSKYSSLDGIFIDQVMMPCRGLWLDASRCCHNWLAPDLLLAFLGSICGIEHQVPIKEKQLSTAAATQNSSYPQTQSVCCWAWQGKLLREVALSTVQG
jgi:hypothetical protein